MKKFIVIFIAIAISASTLFAKPVKQMSDKCVLVNSLAYYLYTCNQVGALI